jgi:hypothetical protein
MRVRGKMGKNRQEGRWAEQADVKIGKEVVGRELGKAIEKGRRKICREGGEEGEWKLRREILEKTN